MEKSYLFFVVVRHGVLPVSKGVIGESIFVFVVQDGGSQRCGVAESDSDPIAESVSKVSLCDASQ
jgi:hypothetical protein